MKKACLYVHKVYQNNAIFDPVSPLNRDNCLEFFHQLKKQLAQRGYDLQTQDLCSVEEAEFVIYNEVPAHHSEVKYPEKSMVLLFESELIRPRDWTPQAHALFKFIFTWHDDYVDNKKYFKFNFTHSGRAPFLSFSQKNKFCTLIAGNKKVSHPLELYSKRAEAIRWFENNHSHQFDLYGQGWGLYQFQIPFFGKFLNRIKPLQKALAEYWPSYRGTIKNKLETLQQYKFSICYENAKDIRGYITEKIFDSMAAGCVPIYWGAPNISDYVPKECYIDRTQFKTYEELYAYLVQIESTQYQKYLESIQKYLQSDQHKFFEAGYNAQKVVERICSDSI